MGLLLFLFHMRFKNLMLNYRKPLTVLLHSLLLVVSISYAIGFSILIDYFAETRQFNKTNFCFIIADYFCFAIPVVLLFFPSFRPKVVLFENNDPIKYSARSFIEISYNFFSPLLILYTVGIFTAFFFSQSISFGQIALWFQLFLLSSVIRLFIQDAVLGYKLVRKLILLFPIGIVMLLYLILNNAHNVFFLSITILFTGTSYHLLKYFPYSETIQKHSIHVSTAQSIAQLLAKAYFRLPAIRVNLSITLVVKIIPLILFLKKPIDQAFPLLKVMYLILISSFIFFTYINNNLWGYLKTTYETLASKGRRVLLFKYYVIMSLFPVSIDAIISTLMISYSKGRIFPSLTIYLLFYLTSLFVNIIVGFKSSMNSGYDVIKSVDFVSFKSNTPAGYNICTMLSSGLISLLFLYIPIMYFLPPLTVMIFYFVVVELRTIEFKHLFGK